MGGRTMRGRTLASLGMLVGVAVGVVLGSDTRPALAGGGEDCPIESECTFRKPAILLILDYSTAMNTVWDPERNLTRWDHVTATIGEVVTPGGFISQNSRLALVRYGHDPDPLTPGTSIPGDGSGLVDGQALDVPWFDPEQPGAQWLGCNGAAIIDSLAATPSPLAGASEGIEPWTRGALELAAGLVAKAKDVDGEGEFERTYINVLATQGAWTNADGSSSYAPAEASPTIPATAMLDEQGARTLVFVLADGPEAEAAAHELASAGGTVEAILGDTPPLVQALQNFVQNAAGVDHFPECVGNRPRVMVLLDASSAMLNVGGQAGDPGETAWDLARGVLSSRAALFGAEALPGVAVEDLAHIGLTVFGDELPAPGEQRVLVQYGPCTSDNIAWALDPELACEQPGCVDPWAGPPIAWTFVDGSEVEPFFDRSTLNHMPRCEGDAPDCAGSGAYVHLGLQAIADNQVAYALASQDPQAESPTHPLTTYVNILVIGGEYTGYSSDAQVQALLEQMLAAGITTFVIGVGEGVAGPAAQAQLAAMAAWGSGGEHGHYDVDSQAELAAALAQIVADIDYDPCCAVADCTLTPEPTTNEPDPVPDPGDGDGDGEPGDGDGDGDGEPGDGDPGSADTDEPPEPTGEGTTDDMGTSGGDSDEGDSTSDEGPGFILDDSCSCATEHERSWSAKLALLLAALGLARVLGRRRRRAAQR